jgi:hypothetical protein
MDKGEGYRAFRGRCKELSEAACAADSTLTLVRGHYYCPIWNSDEAHWWTVRQDGTIHDPSGWQFPSRGLGIYTEFDGLCECSNCGKKVAEERAVFESRYAFCSTLCLGRFVGVFDE